MFFPTHMAFQIPPCFFLIDSSSICLQFTKLSHNLPRTGDVARGTIRDGAYALLWVDLLF